MSLSTTLQPPVNPEAPLPAVPLPYGVSAEFGELLDAVLRVQAGLFSPYRNATVDYVNAKNQRVHFRYTTLPALNAMLKEPLLEAGLIVMHFPKPLANGNQILVSRLIHVPSRQWFECAQNLRTSSEGMQAQGSAMTYARRYAICSLLNIAADDDDDGNTADGNTVISQSVDEEKRALRDRYNIIVHRANIAKDAKDIGAVFDMWMAQLDAWLGLRQEPPDGHRWKLLEDKIATALQRVHGPDPAAAWRASFSARTGKDFEAVRERWDKEWKAGLNRMKADNPAAINQLALHLREMSTRAMLHDQQEAAAPAEAKKAAREEEAQGPYLYDELGEIASDRIFDRATFAEMYVAQHRGSDDTGALERANLAALNWVRESVDAAVILKQIGPRIAVTEEPCAGPQVDAPSTPADEAAGSGPAAEEAPQQDYPAEERKLPPASSLGQPMSISLSEDGTQQPRSRSVKYVEDKVGIGTAEEPLPAETVGEGPWTIDAEGKAHPSRIEQAEVGESGEQLALLPPVYSWVVAIPCKPNGVPDLGAYLLRVKRSLDHVRNAGDLQAWIEANSEMIEDELPAGTRMRAIAMIENRRMVLGLRGAA